MIWMIISWFSSESHLTDVNELDGNFMVFILVSSDGCERSG
jgi:hypothetical protein